MVVIEAVINNACKCTKRMWQTKLSYLTLNIYVGLHTKALRHSRYSGCVYTWGWLSALRRLSAEVSLCKGVGGRLF